MTRYLLAVLVLLGMATPVFADGMHLNVDSTTVNPQWTVTVFNDAGAEIVSGDVVVWDNDDTEFDRSLYPYVTTTTTADFVWVAGVVADGKRCPDQSLCEIVIYGPVYTKIADSTDAAVEDLLVGTSTVAGQAGDYTVAADSCALGRVLELRDRTSGGNESENLSVYPIFVDVACQ